MEQISDDIIHFFKTQGFVIVSTIDSRGAPHNSCKGIVEINKEGEVFLMDLYFGKTFKNLKANPHISITAVDEHKFKGYSLVGKAKIIQELDLKHHTIKAWDDKITSRITARVIKNLREEKGHLRHPEALLPRPKYMILMQTQKVVDLTPHPLK
ncbi:MAG: pyridoxamine 5'-phosphate oxidase family protein [Candidatus Omnitrophota bacterium]